MLSTAVENNIEGDMSSDTYRFTAATKLVDDDVDRLLGGGDAELSWEESYIVIQLVQHISALVACSSKE